MVDINDNQEEVLSDNAEESTTTGKFEIYTFQRQNYESHKNTDFDEPLSPPPGSQLSELLTQLEDYTPTVSDTITSRYFNMAGFSDPVDPRILRIVSVAAQKFISDIANDALQHCKTRTSNSQHSGSHASNKVSILKLVFYLMNILYIILAGQKA